MALSNRINRNTSSVDVDSDTQERLCLDEK